MQNPWLAMVPGRHTQKPLTHSELCSQGADVGSQAEPGRAENFKVREVKSGLNYTLLGLNLSLTNICIAFTDGHTSCLQVHHPAQPAHAVAKHTAWIS